MSTYFAHDGSYGPAGGIVVINTDSWSHDDWNRVEEATDLERLSVAISVALENGDI